MSVIEVNDFSFKYKDSAAETLSGISFSAEAGELIFVCGATACGKTTLLRSLKPELASCGEKSGSIKIFGYSFEEIPPRLSASGIGFVMQRPESQTVTDSVRSELAFAGENLGLSGDIIRRRSAEAAAYFGLEKILDEKTASLSGGQRQLLNLASVMAVYPKLIILDEPTSRLDPVAAGNFIRTLYRITRELAVTVIIAEHSFSELLPVADKVLLIENGKAAVFDTPKKAAGRLASCADIRPSLPVGITVWKAFDLPYKIDAPISAGESRRMIQSCFKADIFSIDAKSRNLSDKTAIKLKNISFTYNRNLPDVISKASLEIRSGEAFTLLGSNGSGKSTLLSIIAGINKPYRGTVEIMGRKIGKYSEAELYGEILSYLPQDVQSTFLHDSVGEELQFTNDSSIYDFRPLYDMHPYDLSGGQSQLLAMKKILMTNPKIILLDEPTNGLDGSWKNIIVGIVKNLLSSGVTVLTVTHDMEFAAMISDRCGIFFDGSIAAAGSPQEILCGSMFYTTEAAVISDGIYKNICTANQLLEICRRNGLKSGKESR